MLWSIDYLAFCGKGGQDIEQPKLLQSNIVQLLLLLLLSQSWSKAAHVSLH
jgi:hypothetical protein